MADKILVASAFIFSLPLPLPSLGHLPIIAREFLVTGLRQIAVAKGAVIAADKLGKWKTTLQLVFGITCLLFLILDSTAPNTAPRTASSHSVRRTASSLTSSMEPSLSLFSLNNYLKNPVNSSLTDAITNVIYFSRFSIEGASVLIEDGIITRSTPKVPGTSILEADALPGFIDIHSHGADGADVCDASTGSLEHIARTKLREGVTTWLPTTLTQLRKIWSRSWKQLPGGQSRLPFQSPGYPRVPYKSRESRSTERVRKTAGRERTTKAP